MADNAKKEEKWTLNFRDDQCQLISDAMAFIINRCDERIGHGNFQPFDQFTSAAVKAQAQAIMQQIAEVTT